MKLSILKSAVTLSFLLTATFANAQRVLPNTWYNNGSVQTGTIAITDDKTVGSLFSIPEEENLDYYWDQDFHPGKVYYMGRSVDTGELILDSLASKEVRMDIWNNRIEFNTPKEIKIMEMRRVVNLLVEEDKNEIAQFIHPEEFGIKDVKGMVKLLIFKNEKAVLMSKALKVTPPTYVAALDTGTKEATIDKKNQFLFWDGDSIYDINSKKEAREVMAGMGINGKAYFKNSKNKLKTEEDYKKLGFFIASQNS
ncbi:hypothetical protein [Jiulongibacter sediminis]|jgi:hypothetical protein|uniref:Uncharacterized protein n=1 Tax=Jiulongibacter sediminis TaxID=1605367 RepID=A0A0P7C7P1_9BACT|nr:hypothetical protein [Jiulongibacter sediminis]KPM48440.1 hypothetical protein AFM12_07335 [Jiulongibacter sediminis]TBX24978.1 hypothetical protein TK44_07340 [Jiulongibacter sediminis]